MNSTEVIFSPKLETELVNPTLWGKILELNLQLIIDRLELKYKWSAKRIEKAILGYRQYLYMTQMLKASLSPTRDIDVVWHEHILHTQKYAIDCQKVFGRFLHHFPTPIKWLKGASCDCDDWCNGVGVQCCEGEFVPVDIDNPNQEKYVPAKKFKEFKLKFFLN